MPNTANPSELPIADDTLTVVSLAVIAFIVADIAHEGIGHGVGFFLAGGLSSMLTTTRLIEWVKLGDPQWRIFDLGGPAGNLLFALLGWFGQRLFRGRSVQLRFFFWLVMAFSLFWAFGYLIFSGITGRGDYMALVEGTKFVASGRVLFVLLGMILYRASIRLAAGELRRMIPVHGVNAAARVKHL